MVWMYTNHQFLEVNDVHLELKYNVHGVLVKKREHVWCKSTYNKLVIWVSFLPKQTDKKNMYWSGWCLYHHLLVKLIWLGNKSAAIIIDIAMETSMWWQAVWDSDL